MCRIQAILFDLDGVLVDACDWHYEALNKALSFFNYNPIGRDDHEIKYNGLPTSVKLKMLNIPDDKAKEINQLKQKYTLEIINDFGHVMNEKIEMFKLLKQMKIKTACVTNSIRETAVQMLKVTGQYEYIDLLISNEDVDKNKPDPKCYNLAVQKLNIDPNETVCVEDSPKGIQAAIASDIKNLIVVKNTTQVNKNNIVNFFEILNNAKNTVIYYS